MGVNMTFEELVERACKRYLIGVNIFDVKEAVKNVKPTYYVSSLHNISLYYVVKDSEITLRIDINDVSKVLDVRCYIIGFDVSEQYTDIKPIEEISGYDRVIVKRFYRGGLNDF